MKMILVTAVATLMMLPGMTLAKVNCAAFEGGWQGQMEQPGGVHNGATAMTIRNCRVNWTLPNGKKNSCRLRARKGQVEYGPCSLGSYGVVTLQGGRLTFQNVYTAARHGAYTVNLRKGRQ